MAPGIHEADRIFGDPFSYLLHEIERGDIITFKYPLAPWVDYVKRVIGIPGDEVVMDCGRVFVNGLELVEPYVEAQDPESRVRVLVPSTHYFVLGDNRLKSCDSRKFGFVPLDYIHGKVTFRVWPPTRFGMIGGGSGALLAKER